MVKVALTHAMSSPRTPEDVEVTTEAREPVTDPTLGNPVASPESTSAPRHRLVTIDDSLTHGFHSGAIYNTDLAYPVIITHELGWDDRFRCTTYNGYGGLPLNLEFLVREVPLALFHARNYLD